MAICGWLFKYIKEMKYIRPLLNLGKNSYFMYLNEAFIIGCMPAAKYRVLMTIFVIILSYILAIIFKNIYKKMLSLINCCY